MNRKKFIRSGSLLAGFSLSEFPSPAVLNNPIMVSTWDSGKLVNDGGWEILKNNGYALDAIEKGGNKMEDQNDCCVGLKGYPDRDGKVTLDACLMDDKSNCGAVAALEQIKYPISVARKVMEKTPHVLLAGDGAQQFAIENGFTIEPATLSPDAQKAFDDWLKKSEYKPIINIENKKEHGPFAPTYFDDGSPNHDTMGMLAMDAKGRLSGGVTTSGMAFKVHGRVGDSPIIGAGLFVDNQVGAATSSGVGEEVIRICGTHLVVEFMRQGLSPEHACKKACERIIQRDRNKAKTLQVGFLALNNKGQYGAYAIQKGFAFAVKSKRINNKIFQAKYFFEP